MDSQRFKELEAFSQYLYKQIDDLTQDTKTDKLTNEGKFRELDKNLTAFEALNKALFEGIKELRQKQENSSSIQIPKETFTHRTTEEIDNISLLIDKYLSKEFTGLENDIEQRLKNEIDNKLKNNKSNSSSGSILSVIALLLSVVSISLIFFGIK